MMKQRTPTDLELYYDGNYIGKQGDAEYFTYKGKTYAILNGMVYERNGLALFV